MLVGESVSILDTMNRSEVVHVSVSRLDTILDRENIDMIRSGLASVSVERLDVMIGSGFRVYQSQEWMPWSGQGKKMH